MSNSLLSERSVRGRPIGDDEKRRHALLLASKKKRPAKETTITQSVIKWINSLPYCRAVKHHGSQYTIAGHPDVYGSLRGRMFLLEGKQPGKHPEPHQWAQMEAWSKSMALVGVYHSLAEAQEQVNMWLDEIRCGSLTNGSTCR